MSKLSFGEEFQHQIDMVDKYVVNYLEVLSVRAKNLHPRYEELINQILDQYKNGGKRLRPVLSMLIYEAYGGDNLEEILPFAATQELLHTAALIADDVIDNDELRHGKKNLLGIYRERFDSGNFNNIASPSIVASILLISEIYQIIEHSNARKDKVKKCRELLGDSIFYMLGGEHIDSDAIFYPRHDTDPNIIMKYKTSYYTFITPMQIGAVLGSAPEQDLKLIQEAGEAIGISYQLCDDILGIFGETKDTGKPVGNDIREGKQTMLFRDALDGFGSSDKIKLENLYGKKNINESEIKEVQDMFSRSKAKIRSEELIVKLTNQAKDILNQLSIDDKNKTRLSRVADSLVKRNY